MSLLHIEVDEGIRYLFIFQIRCQLQGIILKIRGYQHPIGNNGLKLRTCRFIGRFIRMAVKKIVHPYIERPQLLRGTVYARRNGVPVIMLYIIRYDTYYMVTLLCRQTYGKHVGMIIDFIEDFLNLISACTGYVAPVMKHAVYGSGRDAGHACNVFYRIILVFHLLPP